MTITDESTPTGALAGWRIVEIADGVAASFCAKLLADLGAEVVKIEPPDGHPSRRWAPRPTDAAPDETSGRFLYLNTSKSTVTVAAGHDVDDGAMLLVASCDVVITDDAAWYERDDLDQTTTVVVITPYGLTGPCADHRANHLVSFHAGGEGSILPSGAGWKQFPIGHPSRSVRTWPNSTPAGTRPWPRSPGCTTASVPAAASGSTCRFRSRS